MTVHGSHNHIWCFLHIHSFRRFPTSSGNSRLFPYTASPETSQPIRTT